ncbi:MAG: hypothetical protein EZS28_006103 [Streblomastix strix]|uniref:Uncharacterized protein n=1 Tax=Streblomastix strix TaxID=222440 RepID=A0A5J4WU10_9EUKA|nr:MAG: hypothetical protein EZS28_006103 [Streblomastix strix]
MTLLTLFLGVFFAICQSQSIENEDTNEKLCSIFKNKKECVVSRFCVWCENPYIPEDIEKLNDDNGPQCLRGGQFGSNKNDSLNGNYECKYSQCYWLSSSIKLPAYVGITTVSFVVGFVILEAILIFICAKFKRKTN